MTDFSSTGFSLLLLILPVSQKGNRLKPVLLKPKGGAN